MTEEEFKKKAKTIPTNIETEEKIALDYFKYKVLPTTNGTAFESKEEHYTKIVLNVIEKLQKENEELKNKRYKKDFSGERVFCLEYDKETLRDMVLEKQEEIKELKSNSIPKYKIREKIKYYEEIVEKGGYNLPFNRIRVETLKELLEEE